MANPKKLNEYETTKEITNLLFDLYSRQEWLAERHPAVFDLIYLCGTTDRRKFIADLLERFKYLNSKEKTKFYQSIFRKIIDGWGFIEENTQIVATALDDRPDSSQRILDEFKVIVIEEWGKPQLVNRIGRAIPKARKFPNIVLIDEFIGSGKTIINRVNLLKNDIDENIDFKIKVCALMCMKNAKDSLEKAGIEVYSPEYLFKGISDHWEGKCKKKALKEMWKLEGLLQENYQDHILSEYHYGYGKAEALYFQEGGHIVNSVFPIFWWPYLKPNNKRKPPPQPNKTQ